MRSIRQSTPNLKTGIGINMSFDKKAYRKKYYSANKTLMNQQRAELSRAYLTSWEAIIQKVSQCQMCGKDIFFNVRSNDNVVHFDHRHGGAEPIKGTPTNWLKGHKPTQENIKIWRECDFGTLCFSCNSSLPTKNRKQFLENAIKYICLEA